MADIKNYHITISGRVQGVGYRAFATRLARSMRIKGYVKNQLDGSVFVEAEGVITDLDRFVQQCKNGPGWAHVDRVVYEEFPTRGFQAFEVKY